MITITGNLRSVSSKYIKEETIVFTLIGEYGKSVIVPFKVNDHLVVTHDETKSDASGSFSIDLYPNDLMGGNYSYKVLLKSLNQEFRIRVTSLNQTVDITDLFDLTNTQLPQPDIQSDGMWVLQVSNGTQSWVKLPDSATGGDVKWAQIDTDGDGTIDNAKKVNGKDVELNVLNTPISDLEASDDFDNA